jgi:hypothetical protein
VTGAAQLLLPRPNDGPPPDDQRRGRQRVSCKMSLEGGCFAYNMSLGAGIRPWWVLAVQVNTNRGWLGFPASRNGQHFSSACDGDWPPDGRPCGRVKIPTSKQTFYEKENQNKTILARGAVVPPVGRPCNAGTQIETAWLDFRSPRSRARLRRQGSEMMLPTHRRPHGRSPPLGELYLTHVDQSVNI